MENNKANNQENEIAKKTTKPEGNQTEKRKPSPKKRQARKNQLLTDEEEPQITERKQIIQKQTTLGLMI